MLSDEQLCGLYLACVGLLEVLSEELMARGISPGVPVNTINVDSRVQLTDAGGHSTQHKEASP
jgi:hypothetical protein